MMTVQWIVDGRRMHAVFVDRGGALCSISQSSATERQIWFGMDNAAEIRRMLLTPQQVKELLPALQHFAETGEFLLPEKHS